MDSIDKIESYHTQGLYVILRFNDKYSISVSEIHDRHYICFYKRHGTNIKQLINGFDKFLCV